MHRSIVLKIKRIDSVSRLDVFLQPSQKCAKYKLLTDLTQLSFPYFLLPPPYILMVQNKGYHKKHNFLLSTASMVLC